MNSLKRTILAGTIIIIVGHFISCSNERKPKKKPISLYVLVDLSGTITTKNEKGIIADSLEFDNSILRIQEYIDNIFWELPEGSSVTIWPIEDRINPDELCPSLYLENVFQQDKKKLIKREKDKLQVLLEKLKVKKESLYKTTCILNSLENTYTKVLARETENRDKKIGILIISDMIEDCPTTSIKLDKSKNRIPEKVLQDSIISEIDKLNPAIHFDSPNIQIYILNNDRSNTGIDMRQIDTYWKLIFKKYKYPYEIQTILGEKECTNSILEHCNN